MPKDLARNDYVREFIDLLEKHAPTARAAPPKLVKTVPAGRGGPEKGRPAAVLPLATRDRAVRS